MNSPDLLPPEVKLICILCLKSFFRSSILVKYFSELILELESVFLPKFGLKLSNGVKIEEKIIYSMKMTKPSTWGFGRIFWTKLTKICHGVYTEGFGCVERGRNILKSATRHQVNKFFAQTPRTNIKYCTLGFLPKNLYKLTQSIYVALQKKCYFD